MSRDQGMGMGGKGGGYGSTSSGGNGRNPSKQYDSKNQLSPGARQALTNQKNRARARISPSTTATGNVLKGIGVLGFGIPTQITGRMIDKSPMAFGVPKSTRAKKDMSPVDRGGDGSQITKPVAGPISINEPIIPLAQRRSATVSPTGRFGYTVGLKRGGMLRQGKPKLAKKGWK